MKIRQFVNPVLTLLVMGNASCYAAASVDAGLLERISPVGKVNVAAGSSAESAPVAAAASADPAAAGKATYDKICTACHSAGLAGAPKVGDKNAWASRIAQGNETLYQHAIKGFQGKAGMMPAKGGGELSDAEVKAAVDYMVGASR